MKKCKGCKEPLPLFSERNGLKTYKQKHGFGLDCGCFFENQYNNIDKTLKKEVKIYEVSKIPTRSKKRIAQEKIYSQLRKAFLNKNSICPITGEKTTDIHHMKGRIGELLINTRYWLAVSREAHILIEQNPEWAKKQGYSLSRLSND